MAYLDNALLRNECRQARVLVKKLNSAISVLQGLIGRNNTAPLKSRALGSR
jgi:hypothetical protein